MTVNGISRLHVTWGQKEYECAPQKFPLMPNELTEIRLKNVALAVDMPQRKEPLIFQELIMEAAGTDGLTITPVHWSSGYTTGFYWRERENVQFILQEKPSAPGTYEIIAKKYSTHS